MSRWTSPSLRAAACRAGVTACLTFAATLSLRAQDAPALAGNALRNRAAELSTQLAVPPSPAFALVSLEESAILRPTSFQQFATSLSSFAGAGGGFALPRAVGVELAPIFLARGKALSLDQYRAHPARYRLRLSGAIKRSDDATGSTAAALGLRLSLIDETDPRTHPDAARFLTSLAEKIVAICRRVDGPPSDDAEPGAVSCADPRGRVASLTAQLSALRASAPDSLRQGLERQLDAARARAERNQREIDAINGTLERFKQEWPGNAWNRNALDVAVAASAVSRDSLGSDPRFDVLAMWLSGARRWGEWGQLVGGVSARSARDSLGGDRHAGVSLGGGLFFGANRIKGFLQLSATAQQKRKPQGELTGGSEFYLLPGVWAQASLGWGQEAVTGHGRLVTHFALRTAFPQLLPSRGGS
ncbi:MAG: hypothetical protein U0164_22020 [Gemmatimonadaceae bacterium]